MNYSQFDNLDLVLKNYIKKSEVNSNQRLIEYRSLTDISSEKISAVHKIKPTSIQIHATAELNKIKVDSASYAKSHLKSFSFKACKSITAIKSSNTSILAKQLAELQFEDSDVDNAEKKKQLKSSSVIDAVSVIQTSMTQQQQNTFNQSVIQDLSKTVESIDISNNNINASNMSSGSNKNDNKSTIKSYMRRPLSRSQMPKPQINQQRKSPSGHSQQKIEEEKQQEKQEIILQQQQLPQQNEFLQEEQIGPQIQIKQFQIVMLTIKLNFPVNQNLYQITLKYDADLFKTNLSGPLKLSNENQSEVRWNKKILINLINNWQQEDHFLYLIVSCQVPNIRELQNISQAQIDLYIYWLIFIARNTLKIQTNHQQMETNLILEQKMLKLKSNAKIFIDYNFI